MVNRQTLAGIWDQLRQKHGIALRLVESLPEDKLQAQVIPNMRSAAELVVHLYGTIVRDIPESVIKGKMEGDDEAEEKRVASTLTTRRAMLDYMERCWSAGDRAAAAVTDAQLAAMVPTPWGMSFPGWAMFAITQDEFMHHRGQLYAYARVMGASPPMMWDFKNNAEPYQPKQSTGAAS
jgi:uncharacterized damage-inducible protein DinB